MRPPWPGGVGATLILAGVIGFVLSNGLLKVHEREAEPWDPRLELVLPPSLSVVLAGGDRHLAANLQAIRGAVVATHLEDSGQKALFARLMDSTTRLNRAHEDGYYISQSILPWAGLVEANQRIQARAMAGRPWDWLPAFFRGFNLYYFRKRPGEAAPFIREAARRSTGNRQSLMAMAAHWEALGHDPREALKVIAAMADSTRAGRLKRRLQARRTQLQGLIRLREAAKAYRANRGKAPESFDALIGFARLEAIPQDPLGEGYVLTKEGEVRIKRPRPLRQDPQLPEKLR